MKLPNREKTFIQPAKLNDYLLSETHAGGLINLRTVWIIDQGQDRPRFVTAIPN